MKQEARSLSLAMRVGSVTSRCDYAALGRNFWGTWRGIQNVNAGFRQSWVVYQCCTEFSNYCVFTVFIDQVGSWL